MKYVFINGSKEYFEQNNMIDFQRREMKEIIKILNDDNFEGLIFAVKIESREKNIINCRAVSTTVNTTTKECLICFERIQEMIHKLLTDIEKSYSNQKASE